MFMSTIHQYYSIDPLKQFKVLIINFFKLKSYNVNYSTIEPESITYTVKSLGYSSTHLLGEGFTIKVLEENNLFIYFFFTNYMLSIGLICLVYSLIYCFSLMKIKIVPTKYQYFIESLYKTFCDLLVQNIGKDGLMYLPFIFVIFNVIFISNLIGLTPYTFTITSHISITFALSSIVFIGLTILGFVKQSWKFLYLFVPKNIPVVLLPFLVAIEIVSYVSRVFSLAIRLFANMLAGHALVFILAGFAYIILTLGDEGFNFIRCFSIIPITSILLLTILEIGVAILQSYVFVVLICIYLNDAYHAEH